MTKLTTTDKSDLQKLKKVVNENERAFVAAGNALAEIQERKLYREESLTFEHFCLKNWNWKKSHVYRLIQGAATVKTSPAGGQIPNERVARELAKYPPEKHRNIIASVSESGKPLTAPAVAKAVRESAPKPVIILDETGYPVPEKALRYWERREEVQGLLTTVSRLRTLLKAAKDNKDLLFVEVTQHDSTFQGVMASLDQCYASIKRAKPFCVCPTCQGRLVEKCAICGGRGIISEILYQRVPTEIKKLRMASLRKL